MTFQLQLNKRIYTKKLFFIVLLIVTLIPTYFIHKTTYPDWGDDFAQYVYQGQQINKHSESYKRVLNIEEYSSPKRSVTFSILLSIIPNTNCFQDYIRLNSFVYILAGVCFFLFLTSHFTLTISLLTTLIVFYNHFFLSLKSEIVPEFLFIAFFYLILYLRFLPQKWLTYFIPFLIALLVSTRFIGLSLLFSYLIYTNANKSETVIEKIKSVLISLIIFSIPTLFVNFYFLPSINNNEFNFYATFIKSNLSPYTFLNNINLSISNLNLFFENEIPTWLNIIFSFFAFCFLMLGLIISFKENKKLTTTSLVFYLLFLFIYPYNIESIRFLIPIFPLFIFFIVSGIYHVSFKMSNKKSKIIMTTILSLVFLSHSKSILINANNLNNSNSFGPNNNSVLNDFKTIQSIVKPNENIAFSKPFIINLLGDRNSYFINNENQLKILAKADYYLYPKQTIVELHQSNQNIKITKGDTIFLANFYLIKL